MEKTTIGINNVSHLGQLDQKVHPPKIPFKNMTNLKINTRK
jgi:hypothetical protein